MSRNFISSLLLLLPLLLTAGQLLADKRAYVWTYQYLTMSRGTAEVEYYTTFSSTLDPGMARATTSEHRLELEIGMHDHFDMALYQIFEQLPGESLRYTAFQIRARYRLGERDLYPVDPLLYLEYRGVPDFSAHKVEFKFIAARDWGPVNLALNPGIEWEKEDGTTELKAIYAAGISYALGELLGIGLEVKGSKSGHYAGPVISHGKEGLYVALGSGFALSGVAADKPRFMLRLIVGVEF